MKTEFQDQLDKGQYGCEHFPHPIIIDDNLLSVAAYHNWRETTGPDGDRSECWECYCKKKVII